MTQIDTIQAALAALIVGAFVLTVGSFLWALGKGDGVPEWDRDRGYRADDCSDFDGPL